MTLLPEWALHELWSLLPAERLDSPRHAAKLEELRRKIERLQADGALGGREAVGPPSSHLH